MKNVKFRLVKKENNWYAEIRTFLIWKKLGTWYSAEGGSVKITDCFKSKMKAIKAIKNSTKFKNDNVEFIQYPTLKYR